ncbi:NIPSNAP family protein [bacterium]|nr:NIPSNAP family protein [bacterium]
MIYEERIYTIVPGKMQDINNRFANVTMRLFEKHGMKVVGFWQTIIGSSSINELVYILAFEDLSHRQAAWEAFRNDKEWQQAKRESETDGPLVSNVANKILQPTPYSPIQ